MIRCQGDFGRHLNPRAPDHRLARSGPQIFVQPGVELKAGSWQALAFHGAMTMNNTNESRRNAISNRGRQAR